MVPSSIIIFSFRVVLKRTSIPDKSVRNKTKTESVKLRFAQMEPDFTSSTKTDSSVNVSNSSSDKVRIFNGLPTKRRASGRRFSIISS